MKAVSVSKDGWEGKVETKTDNSQANSSSQGQNQSQSTAQTTTVQTSNAVQQAHSASSKELAENPDLAKKAADEMRHELDEIDRRQESGKFESQTYDFTQELDGGGPEKAPDDDMAIMETDVKSIADMKTVGGMFD